MKVELELHGGRYKFVEVFWDGVPKCLKLDGSILSVLSDSESGLQKYLLQQSGGQILGVT